MSTLKKNLEKTSAICVSMWIVWSGVLFAQNTVYHSVAYPYDADSRFPQTLGSVVKALPDLLSDVQSNPAGLAQFTTAQIIFQTSPHFSHYAVESEIQSAASFNEFQLNAGHFAVSFPGFFLKKRTVLGFSSSQIAGPEFEVYPVLNEINTIKIDHSRNGYVGNASIGVGMQVTDHLSLGISLTKWFGYWSWNDKMGENTAAGTFHFPGYSSAVSLRRQFGKVTLAAVAHSPFTLMKADDVQVDMWDMGYFSTFSHHFTGAARLAVAYHITPQLTLGAGYRYQGPIIVQNDVKGIMNSSGEDRTGASHQISWGGEYLFGSDKISIPVFIAFRLLSPMENERSNLFLNYQILSDNDRSWPTNEFIMGMSLLGRSFGFSFSAQWNNSAVHAMNSIAPPYS
ncbi:MAG: hypothetical protein EHM72_07500 [Calditrichaeota bacterium]|nr:MAG: hypothetical protein EHM72_07500 [Calditrichota bacterium]